MSKILPFLFLGNQHDASSKEFFDRNRIDHVLNVTNELPFYFNGSDIIQKRIPADDSSTQNLKMYFDGAIDFIEMVRRKGGNVLVHCYAGVSRSPAIVMAYMIAMYRMNVMDSYRFVKRFRDIIEPNFHFMGQLMEFDQRINDRKVD
jgi:dual specificity MAP kinase phosphatase